MEPKTLKGFRDFLPKEARKRQYVIDKLRSVFESYGFEPLETPALEYAEILEGKYGEEGERLMYKFEDKGGRKVALRYDQTVPLARIVAQYSNGISLPFKRYQIQNVWRGENPQAGRFREFLQCDIDTVGTSSLLADAEIIEIAISSLEALGFKGFKVLINDRKVFSGLIEDSNKLPTIVRTIDKLKKNGQEKVIDEIVSAGIEKELAEKILQTLETQKPTDNINRLFDYLSALGISEGNFEFAPFLARGLDYYTSTIFEIEIEGYEAGSVCGGGRYDDLIGMFGGKQIPAVGCSFGFDRVIEAMDTLSLFPQDLQTTRILVTVFSPELLNKSIETCEILNKSNISCELYVDPNAKMDRQLKYADQKGISYVVIVGPKEAETNSVTVKDLRTSEQRTIPLDQLPTAIR
ncbi:MAG: histidine--tRNA ligase [Candidatus Levybacteria bacterium RIFCSPHIGHO2_01_FULL_40_15b]|nr:MAG: histidine--tRNA ligase [Candidatus Levybacteria bacterium RIFCSPHIGHO2_01_FULL_40_15b]